MKEYKTCTHIHDNGHYCQSAAVSGRNFCVYHLRHRGLGMRMAQSRARCEQFNLRLPPLENMHAVQSALSQVAEALAADMIELKRARALLAALHQAADNFKHPDAWQASAYASDQSQPHAESYDNFEAEYGLPEQLDLNLLPEVAFPPPDTNTQVGCPVQAGVACAGVSPHGANIDRPPLIPVIPPPVLRDYVAEAEIAMTEVTPQDLELNEIMRTEGLKAMESRALEHERDANRKRRRKLYRANYERYVAEAKMKNIQRAAEKLLAERQAAEQAAAAQEVGCPIPPSVGGVGLFPDTTKKPPVSAARDNIAEKKEEAIA